MAIEKIRSASINGTRKRRAETGREEIFKLVAAVFYQPDASLLQLSKHLELSVSTIKRLLNKLRRLGIFSGRLGTIRCNFGPLRKSPTLCSSALVAADVDVQRLKAISRNDAPAPYRSEEDLLKWICRTLPMADAYNGQIVIETGYIVMGDPEFALIVTVHAISSEALFKFVREGIEFADGISRTRTIMIAHSVR